MMVTLNAGGSGESPTPSGTTFNATTRSMVAKGSHALNRRRRVGKGTIGGYGGGYKPATGTTVVDSSTATTTTTARQSASSNPDPAKASGDNTGAPPTSSSSSTTPPSGASQPQHSGEAAPPKPAKPCHSARMSVLCCQNAIRMGARTQLGLCPPGRPRRSLQAALRQRTRATSSHSSVQSGSRRLSLGAAADANGYYALEKMIGTQSLEDYEDQEEDYLLSTNTFDVESDEEASSGDEDELGAMDSLLSPESPALDNENKYVNLREPMFTPIGADGSLTNANGTPMVSGMGTGASGKLPFNRRKLRYFDGITAQDRQAARTYLRDEADKARRRNGALLKRHLKRMQKFERSKRRMQNGEMTNDIAEDDTDLELIDAGVGQFEQPMTTTMSAALILESLSLNSLESIEGMAKCYDGIVAAGVALLESQHSDVTSPVDVDGENEKPRTSRADVLAALAPLLITSLNQPSGDVIMMLARMRRMCGTPRYQRRFVQRVAPCLIRPKNAAMWCLRHQHDMEPITAAAELIFDCAHEIFSKGWYEKGQLYLADSKRAETLNSAAAQLRNLSGEPSGEGLSLALTAGHSHGIRRYMSGTSSKEHKGSNEHLAEWEVMAIDKEIGFSISKIMSSDWNRVNLNTKDSDSVRSFRRTTSVASKRPSVLPQSSSGEASPRAMILSPRSPSRPLGMKTPLSPPPPKDFSLLAPQSESLFENIMPTQPGPADRPTSPDNSFVQKNINTTIMSPPPAPRQGDDNGAISSSTPPRSPKSPKRDGVEQAPPLSKPITPTPTPFTPISPRRSKVLSPPSSQNIQDAADPTAMAPFTPSLGMNPAAPLSPSSIGTSSTSELTYRPNMGASMVSAGSGASQAAHYRTLTSTASERKRTVAACRALRAQITRFEDAFIQLHGRPPKGAAERAPLATTYSQYREWKRAIRADAACRIQALFRGARLRWDLMRSDDSKISDIVRRRAGRKEFSGQATAQSARQLPNQENLLNHIGIPVEIGDTGDVNRSGGLIKPHTSSSVGITKSPAQFGDTFPGQPTGQVLTTPQWATQVSPAPPNASTEFASFSLADLQSKKRELKQQLKQYDMNFARKHGRMPVKKEKEPIRHLYEEYNALKSQIAMLEQEGPRHPQVPTPGVQPPPSKPGGVPSPPQDRFIPFAPPTPPDSGSDSERSIDSPLAGTGRGAKPSRNSTPPITPTGAPSQDLAALKAEKAQLHQMLRSYEKDFFKEHKRQVSSFADIKPVASQYRRYKEIKKQIAALQGSSDRQTRPSSAVR
ncbi:expressed unknown protein [Seminavis robusta]|uniref:FAM13A-like domain-containing protein n=1 Tax=Seminavis robusta TaxID=568900 RepID=A0A9N8DLF8_9STRA|nr:expressed unknown protein [Seminavis robusta]|eukprot:Sro189_g081580.1 n/a (1274) ;mRNA; r:68451-72350